MSNTTIHSSSFKDTIQSALLILCSLATSSKSFNVGVTS